MKVLDLGAHDGFIGAWLRSQKSDLTIDGMELEPRGVEACLRRGYREVVQGFAEEAPCHFEPGSYDVVFAGELLEHVVDVERLLQVCETMVKPEGLVVVSTPDGTFGEGNNPHHLRVYRSIDLAELLRRRGTLHRMAVGRDGLTLAAYRPKPRRGELAIHTGGGWMRWAPQDIEQRGLGGSETAAVKLADALAELGWVVTVYGEVEQGCHSQVVYRHHQTFDPLAERDVLISSRMPELFDRPLSARVKLLWMHDTDCGERLTRERASHIDHVLVLSQWHREHVEDLYPWLRYFAPADPVRVPDLKGGTALIEDQFALHSKVVQVRNGVDLDRFRRNELPERQRRVLYTSSPDRGLDLLLELWPRIRERVPDAELHFAYAPVYFAIAEQDAKVAEHAQRIERLSDQPGVQALGSLSQPELAELMLTSMVWCCPSYNTPHQVPFYETSCIGAMEAQAAGCWVVASNWGALPETVKVGALIDAQPRSEAWERCFVEAIVRGLTNELVQSEAQTKGPQATAELGWGPVAEQITGIVEREETS